MASAKTKRLAVALTGGVEGPPMGRPRHDRVPPPAHVPTPGVPSERQIRRYRAEYRNTFTFREPLPKGHRLQKLSAGELRVLGGWILRRWDDHNITSIENIQAWVYEVFGEYISSTAVERYLSKIHIVSKAVTEKELKYWNPNLVKELHQFLVTISTRLQRGLRPNQLVAVDVCYWTKSGHILRTFGPLGRYRSFNLIF